MAYANHYLLPLLIEPLWRLLSSKELDSKELGVLRYLLVVLGYPLGVPI